MQAELSGPTQQLQLAQGDQAGGQRGLHPCQDACPLHGGSMFRGTGVDGAPLTHSPVRDPINGDAGRPCLVSQRTHGHLRLKFSGCPLHSAPPGELTQVYLATLLENWKHLHSFQPAWNRQPEPFSLFACWTCMGSCFLQRKARYSEEKLLTVSCRVKYFSLNHAWIRKYSNQSHMKYSVSHIVVV